MFKKRQPIGPRTGPKRVKDLLSMLIDICQYKSLGKVYLFHTPAEIHSTLFVVQAMSHQRM